MRDSLLSPYLPFPFLSRLGLDTLSQYNAQSHDARDVRTRGLAGVVTVLFEWMNSLEADEEVRRSALDQRMLFFPPPLPPSLLIFLPLL